MRKGKTAVGPTVGESEGQIRMENKSRLQTCSFLLVGCTACTKTSFIAAAALVFLRLEPIARGKTFLRKENARSFLRVSAS